MLTSRKLLNYSLSLGLFLGLITGHADAVETSKSISGQSRRLHRIEQPLFLRIGVTLGGSALIGLELWWFQFSHTKTQQNKMR
ncbi:MAG: hypothetical protein QNJ46_23150 [Leptolyngbyaceae cyanobacterium MO_188.B28]|nr:hypothetical protein [Leptolyngbyaceae cyanobacterium MO_188.B28]